MPEKKEQQSITITKIAVGVAAGMLIFSVGTNLIGTILSSNFSGSNKTSLELQIEQLARSSKVTSLGELMTEEEIQEILKCNGTCATVTYEALSEWPLTAPAPVVATCTGNPRFLKVNNQWYEHSEETDSSYPNWKIIQKKNGFWPFQTEKDAETFSPLEKEIQKACNKQ